MAIKSLNMSPDIAARLDNFLQDNPSVSLTLVMQQALDRFLGENKSKPKKDGSGKGKRANKGRGGCDNPIESGKGKVK